MVDILLIKTNLDLQSNKLIRWILVPTTVEVTNGVEAQYHPEVAKSLIESGKVAPIQIMHQLKYLHRLEKDQTQGHLSEQVICVKNVVPAAILLEITIVFFFDNSITNVSLYA